MQSTANVQTEQAQRFLVQLCKHFEHRLPATYQEGQGEITFPAGRCELAAEPGHLILTVKAEQESDIAMLEDVVARHLLRFAFREPPQIAWKREGAGPG